jgi:predicted RNA-binding protein YlxR (DUF448 family)
VTLHTDVALGEEALRERRCIVTGETLAETMLVRFVADPDGKVVPDIAAALPGRGLWVRAGREFVERAVRKNCFAKAAKASLVAADDLADRTERLLVRRMQDDIGMARRAGLLVAGHDNVLRSLEKGAALALLIEASDGAEGGRRKLRQAASSRGLEIAILDCLASAELSVALGRENVIHAAVKSGRLANRLVADAGRLEGFRPRANAGQVQLLTGLKGTND